MTNARAVVLAQPVLEPPQPYDRHHQKQQCDTGQPHFQLVPHKVVPLRLPLPGEQGALLLGGFIAEGARVKEKGGRQQYQDTVKQ